MTRDSIPPTRREGVLVLGPLGIAVSATVCGAEASVLAPLWLAALAWAVLASFVLALMAGLRRGDWSAFRDYRHEPDREEDLDEDLRVGGYAFLRDTDRRVLVHSAILTDRGFPADGNDALH